MSTDFDVVILGAGPAGAATARWLQRWGCHVALVERSCFDTLRVGESLAPAVQPLLTDLGVWPHFLAMQPLPSYGTRSLWGNPAQQVHSHVVTPWGCGWHVDRLAFDRMLADAARGVGANIRCGTTVVRCDRSANGWELQIQGRGDGLGERISLVRAKVVIDATGRAARLATWVSARRFLLDHLVSIAAQFTGIDDEREGYVMVETTSDGWWYSAPVPDGRMMVMLMTDSDLCGRSDFGSPPVWYSRLERAVATRDRVARGKLSWGPRVISAISQRLRRTERRQPWLAVGDAALAVDPISGSGVVRALRSARSAAETTLALLKGHTERIEKYETEQDHQCTNYLHERALYYGMEKRWTKSTFWQRRVATAESFQTLN
jgi:flavin-dependent dehydrogenase